MVPSHVVGLSSRLSHASKSYRVNLLFAAVRRIAANRCFHGSPVFDSFHGDVSTIKAGI